MSVPLNGPHKILCAKSELTSVEHSGLHVQQVLAEALVFVGDLEGQLTGVAQHDHANLASNRLDLHMNSSRQHLLHVMT